MHQVCDLALQVSFVRIRPHVTRSLAGWPKCSAEGTSAPEVTSGECQTRISSLYADGRRATEWV